MLIPSKAVVDVIARLPHSDTTRLLLELCKRFFQSWHDESMHLSDQESHGTFQYELFKSITNTVATSQAFKVANKIGLVDELWKTCNLLSALDDDKHELFRLSAHAVAAMCHSAVGLRYVDGAPTIDAHMPKQFRELAKLSFRELLGFLSRPAFAKAIFKLDDVQAIIFRVVTKLHESFDFTVALNSPDDECPLDLSDVFGSLQILRSCLSSQYASASLMLIQESPLAQFIAETFTAHKKELCMSSCRAEDTCCVAFQLVLALASSVPAMLECSGLLSALKLLNLDEKRPLQRGLLCSDNDLFGSCSFLENQLCYEFEFIGGPGEKLPLCELFAFDDGDYQLSSDTHDKAEVGNGNTRRVSDFAFTLQNKIRQAVKDGIESRLSAPIDFVLISQASWELINDLEANSMEKSPCGGLKSAATFTEVFAKLMYDLATSKRSRLGPTASSLVGEQNINTPAWPTRNGETFFPTDPERKLMNRLYKNYAHRLSLEVSPTLLHCIVKTFGKAAMDCFPVTILMVLYPSYDETDISSFLSFCITSPSAGYLWPRSASHDDAIALPATVIAEGVEMILEREFPEVLQVIDQCHCSLSSLVLRWHSQNFWNYFEWENVVIYTYFTIVYGAEFQVYIIVAVLKHLEPTMRELTANHSSQSLAPFLTLIREPIRNFHFSPWRTLLLRLRAEYHEEVATLLFP